MTLSCFLRDSPMPTSSHETSRWKFPQWVSFHTGVILVKTYFLIILQDRISWGIFQTEWVSSCDMMLVTHSDGCSVRPWARCCRADSSAICWTDEELPAAVSASRPLRYSPSSYAHRDAQSQWDRTWTCSWTGSAPKTTWLPAGSGTPRTGRCWRGEGFSTWPSSRIRLWSHHLAGSQTDTPQRGADAPSHLPEEDGEERGESWGGAGHHHNHKTIKKHTSDTKTKDSKIRNTFIVYVM